MSYKISLIVPVYKTEKYLEKCIKSILSQTFTNFELLLINDGSPDNSAVICEKYSTIDNRVRVIHKGNAGLSSARNVGIEQAKGDYIAFVDSDDYIHPQMYELLYKTAKENDSDIVICNYKDVYEQDRTEYELFEKEYKVNPVHYTNIEALEQLYSDIGVQFVIACNKLYKRGLFQNLRFEVGKIHEDEFMAHKILYNSTRITQVPVALYYYLQRGDGIVRGKFNIKKLHALEAYMDRISFFKELNQDPLIKKAEYSYISLFFISYYKVKNELPECRKELRSLKSTFRNNLYSFINNPYFSAKEKIAWFLFVTISPLHKWINK